jgi:shikimate dehydrogenase
MTDTPFEPTPAQVAVQHYAVFGQPIAHSRSPLIHRRFASAQHVAMDYVAIEAGVDGFAAALADFEARGGRGANCTLPLKFAAYARARELGAHARASGTVNTLTHLPGGGWRGDNTDGIGLVADIAERHRLDLRGRRTLVLGAGGAVQGVIPALLDAGVGEISIVNRNPQRADALVDRIGEPARCRSEYWADLATLGSFDLILNGTSAGHTGVALELPFSIADRSTLVYDMNYGKASIDFLAWGRATGSNHVHDGLGMLVEQAAESFRIWHGVRPDTTEVYDELRRLA